MVNYLTELLIPLALIVGVFYGSKHLSKMLKEFWVEAAGNEWMVIIKNGQMVRAGVGLKTFKLPFQQVVKFPSQVHNVSVNIENVTKEMQGLEVSANLVWSIYREDNGPFLAYKNIGTDLMSTNPRTANENLTSLANSILRNQIANSTINDILRNRGVLREKIREEMFTVVKGWGIWLETVEITDVRISSSSLFRDLQASFREEQNRKAEVFTMQINNELQEIRNSKKIVEDQKQAELDKQREIYVKGVQMQMAEENVKTQEELNQIQQQRELTTAELNDFKRKLQYELIEAREALDLELRLYKMKLEQKQAEAQQAVTQASHETTQQVTAHQLKKDQRSAQFELEEQKKEQELNKLSMDKRLRQYNLIQSAKNNLSKTRISNLSTVYQNENNVADQVFFSMMQQKKITEGLMH